MNSTYAPEIMYNSILLNWFSQFFVEYVLMTST